MTIGLVTDSTAYIPEALTHSLNIEVVDVHVIIDGVSFSEHDISSDDVVIAMRQGKSVTTSRPNPDEFVQAYQRLRSQGCDSVLAVHMSSSLSGTYESATKASQDLDFEIQVVDSRGVGAMFGFPVLDAATLKKRQTVSLDELRELVEQQCALSSIELYVDTLEFLQRGGRISKTQSRIGEALSVKPLLQMVDGAIQQHQLLRTSSKALKRMVDLSARKARSWIDHGQEFHIAVHHSAASDRANMVAQQLCEQLEISSVQVTAVGAVITAHVGPGAVAVVVTPKLKVL